MQSLMSEMITEDDRETDGVLRGLAVAVVTNNEDPEGLARVRVRLAWQDKGEATYWARLAVPMAMADKGFCFLPEVDDEVLVGFERGELPVGVCFFGKELIGLHQDRFVSLQPLQDHRQHVSRGI